MKLKKAAAVCMTAVTVLSLAACGSSTTGSTQGSSSSTLTYDSVTLGDSYKDVTATIKVLTHRTDLLKDDYKGTNWASYIKAFNEMYPNITVNIEGITDYASDSLLRLQGGDWGDVMMIPQVDKADVSNYFLSYGDSSSMDNELSYLSNWTYEGKVYGIPSTATAQGIVYNKKVFTDAGITSLPKTPDEFIQDLKAIKEKTSATPLYTNYAAGWTMGAWDAYISGTATGDSTFMNQKLLHTAAPFTNNGKGSGAYNVYKILYDAVSDGLTENDYTTTDWEGSKGMLNNGQIGCMVLGSWAYSQMKAAGSNGSDIGYMPFPITVDGKQYASAGPDYNYGINCKTSTAQQEASMVFVKWMTEKSGFSYNEGGLPIVKSDTNYPEVYQSFIDNKITFVADDAAVKGEEDLLNELNSDSELMVNNGGNKKIQAIIEHAANKDMSFDAIMESWNQKWSQAQKNDGVAQNY